MRGHKYHSQYMLTHVQNLFMLTMLHENEIIFGEMKLFKIDTEQQNPYIAKMTSTSLMLCFDWILFTYYAF